MTDSNSLKRRDVTFDVMKGIGILLVITAHFFSWNHPILGRSITSFHMPMFFLVAGYFSKPFVSWDDTRVQLKKYARRLLPAFVFTQVFRIMWAVLMALTKGEGWGPVIKETLSLFWADPNGPNTVWGNLSIGVTWFLIALFVAKCALLVLTKWEKLVLPVSIILSVGAFLLHKVFPHSIWCISVGLTALPFVAIGWWTRNHTIPVWGLIVCVVCWFFAIFYSNLGMYDMEWKCFPLDFLGACGGTFCLYLVSGFLSKFCGFLSRFFAILGIWSLAIMCFHDIEMHCHLGNHVMALFPFTLPLWGKFVFRYFLTIALAAIAVKTPVLKRVFV